MMNGTGRLSLMYTSAHSAQIVYPNGDVSEEFVTRGVGYHCVGESRDRNEINDEEADRVWKELDASEHLADGHEVFLDDGGHVVIPYDRPLTNPHLLCILFSNIFGDGYDVIPE